VPNNAINADPVVAGPTLKGVRGSRQIAHRPDNLVSAVISLDGRVGNAPKRAKSDFLDDYNMPFCPLF
jgi:hypothetical protein